MESSQREKISQDLSRLGARLNNYLLALQAITEDLSNRDKDSPPSYEKIDELLKKTLPHLKKAFNSNLGFIADAGGAVVYTDPPENHIVGEILTDIPLVKSAIERDGYIVVNVGANKEDYPELYSLGLFSLLAVPFETPLGLRYIGVANGRNDPPYLGEDRRFLDELMKILAFGLNYGQEIANAKLETELQLFTSRYHWARARGEWEYIARASEDYARALHNSELSSQRGIDKNGTQDQKKHDGMAIDDLLADYLNAEFCHFLKNPVLTVNAEQEKHKTHLTTEPWNLFKFSKDGKKINVILKENNEETKELALNDYPRTAYAVARICLYAGHLRTTSSLKGVKSHESKRRRKK